MGGSKASIAEATANKRLSLDTGPSNSKPNGKPALVKPMGMLMPGIPALLPGSVLRM
jgi:hypothetical protein